MSSFLLPPDQFYSSQKLSNSNEKTNIFSLTQKAKDLDTEDSKNEPKFYKQNTLYNRAQQIHEQKRVIMISELSYQLKALFSIKTIKKKQQLCIVADILAQDNNYYKASNAFQVLQIYRNFNSQHSHFKNDLFCLKLNPSKRQIKIQLPFYLNFTWKDQKNTAPVNEKIYSIFRTFVTPHLSLIELSLKNILKDQGRGRSKDYLFQKPNKTLQLLKTYTSISHLMSHITCQPQTDKKFAQRIQMRQRYFFDKIIQNKQSLQHQIIKNNYLFNSAFTEDSQIIRNYTFQQLVQNKDIRTKIFLPIPPQNKNPQQNFMVYNKIELKQINQYQFQKINKGGFADIFLAQINYWYPSPADPKISNYKTVKNLIRDRVVMKRQIIPDDIFDIANQSTYQSRRDHQIKIIQKLKKAKSIYLPKYYFPFNIKKVDNFIFKNSIILQYIPFKTIGQLLQNNFSYLSLHSKLKLMFHICQGIRYLRDFDIVHLDIKPNNILTYYNYYIKLIDFGQSYHPDVCMKGYKPGFTIPYSPPETFNEKNKMYSSKSDVFSTGVVFYQILFNEFPFQIYKNTTQYNDQMKKYLQQGWYYSPELKQSYGDSQILRILINLIFRCLSFNQECRPELDWIAVILKHMLQIVV